MGLVVGIFDNVGGDGGKLLRPLSIVVSIVLSTAE